MKIRTIELFGLKLSYVHGEYVMSKGRKASFQDSTLVRISTEDGCEGWGESSTLGGTYLPTFVGSTRAALVELAPALIGLDGRNIGLIHRTMDAILMGQANAKSAIDIACWDVLGKAAGLPIATLLGGVLMPDFPLYEAVPLGSPDEMVDFVRRRGEAGITRFQLKVGNDPYDDAARTRRVAEIVPEGGVVIADANGGWNLSSATIAIGRLADLDVYIEQPCRDTVDCAIARTASPLPLILDESVLNAAELFRAKHEARAAAVNIKLGRVGGMTAATRMRNLAQDLQMSFCIEDFWGGDIVTAAVSHVAASSSPEHLLHCSFFNDWTDGHVAGYQPRSRNGRGAAPTRPGLGIDVDADAMGAPLAVFGSSRERTRM